MMTPKKKRVYITMFSVVGVAFIVDRVFLGDTPDRAAAVQIIVDPPSAELASQEVDIPQAIPELHFPHEFPSYVALPTKRDFFAPPLSVMGRNDPQKAGKSNAGKQATASSSEEIRATFEKEVTLNGVLIQDGLKIAVTNGAWVHIGQSYRGCRLKSVSGNRAVFDCDGEDAVLKVTNDLINRHD